MPWIYRATLSEFEDPETVQSDWENSIPGNATVQNDYGGVTVSRRRTEVIAVIVSQRNNPKFQEMENLPYVNSISERKEIPARSNADFEPPIELADGINLVE